MTNEHLVFSYQASHSFSEAGVVSFDKDEFARCIQTELESADEDLSREEALEEAITEVVTNKFREQHPLSYWMELIGMAAEVDVKSIGLIADDIDRVEERELASLSHARYIKAIRWLAQCEQADPTLATYIDGDSRKLTLHFHSWSTKQAFDQFMSDLMTGKLD